MHRELPAAGTFPPGLPLCVKAAVGTAGAPFSLCANSLSDMKVTSKHNHGHSSLSEGKQIQSAGRAHVT